MNPDETPEDAIVTSKAQMVAAIRAAAHPTFEAARKRPRDDPLGHNDLHLQGRYP